MAQIQKKFIATNAVDETKIRLSNTGFLKARNAANSADVNILQVNISDRIVFSSVPQVTADAVAGNDLVRYSQFASALEGLKPKQAVYAATTGNINLASATDPNPIDGVTLPNGARVLLWQQTSAAQNGIYVAVTATDPTTWVRSNDFNDVSEIPGAYTVTEFGTLYQGVLFVSTSSPAVLGTDPINFALRAITAISGGDMIAVAGGVVSVDLASVSGLESTIPGNAAGQLRVKLEATNPTLKIDASNQLGVKLDPAGAIVATSAGVSAAVDNSTIALVGNQIIVKTGGITNTQVSATAAIAYSKLALTNSIVNADINTAAAISYSKLALTNSIVNADIAAGAAIAYAKLNLANSVTAADQNSGVAASGTVLTANGSGAAAYLPLPAYPIAASQQITLTGTDITNQYVDLAQPARGASASNNSVIVAVFGGPQQLKAVDYTVALTGGGAGATRITFAGDLATGGSSALIAGDVLMINYIY